MICPKCKELGQKSIVHPHGGMSTSMYCPPFYDEEGIYHNHDRNVHTSSYSCSMGHRIVTKGTGVCPNCDWGKDNQETTVEDIGPQTLTLNGSNIVIF